MKIVTTALLIAAGATAAGLLGAVPPAHAADAYIALSLGYINENPPVTMAGGSAISTDQETARVQSLTNCQNNGGGHCVTVVIAQNACAAAASNDYGEEKGAQAATVAAAESAAKAQLQNQQGAKIIVSGCSNGQTPPPPSQPPTPPPAPKLGPTVSWDLIVGGFVAHITDRSGVASQCTYASEELNRSFALPANGTYDLKVVPAVPQFRDWTVTITCDNGTSTTATHHF
ncbi:MAG TPA: DUF4189 domain-containing protein [Mycobacterium sp.]|nr:DUF4189 domain-containing protein [Mycobacterium sp.]